MAQWGRGFTTAIPKDWAALSIVANQSLSTADWCLALTSLLADDRACSDQIFEQKPTKETKKSKETNKMIEKCW